MNIMTNEEAIKDLKNLLEHADAVGFAGSEIEALEIAIEAIEKQILKKPDLEGDGYYNGELIIDTWICPSCGMKYEIDVDDYEFCPHCGQALYWSNEE